VKYIVCFEFHDLMFIVCCALYLSVLDSFRLNLIRAI
jgi:hypothetical protein